MRYTIEGFSQEYAITLRKNIISGGKEKLIKLDCTDLVILRWFVDFYPKMRKMTADGNEYAWLSHKKLQEDLPILDISKRSCIDRMQKLVEFEILEYKCLKEGGTFSLYRFGKNYENLISSKGTQLNEYGEVDETAQGMQLNNIGVMQSNGQGVNAQPHNKDSNIIDSSIIDTNIKYNDIIDYLNAKAGTKFKAASKTTQQHIHARLQEGYSLDDFKIVIDKKCASWLGTEWEQYLRPTTLFGTKFEAYLNAPVTERKNFGKTGVEIKQTAEDDLAGIF